MQSLSDFAERIVNLVLTEYDSCKFKPSNDYQYMVLAAFVLEADLITDDSSSISSSSNSSANLKVVSLATGAKCLPTVRYPIRGDTLHDSHAEVLARRSLIRWLYEEVQRAAHSTTGSPWVERQPGGKWALKENVNLHMYISTVPCGDASMRFLAATQDPAMAALKDTAPPAPPPQGAASRGRNNYALHGVLRTKPGRADSPPTRCMSCSDKLAAWNVLGVQGALAASLFAPVYIRSVTLGDVPEDLRPVVREDCERALYGRLTDIAGLPDGYHLATPALYFTSTAFKYSKLSLQALAPDKPSPPSSNESLCWFAESSSGQEIIINGARRGIGAKHRGLEKYRPRICKLQLFRLYLETCRLLQAPEISPDTTYYQAKRSCALYAAARIALKGPGGPFAGWVFSGEHWESFNSEGNVEPLPTITQ